MPSRRARFRNLERGRAALPTAGAPAVSAGRFDALEAHSPAAPPVTQAREEPSREPGNAGLELLERRDGDQPFIRCARCEADNGPLSSQCWNCAASLQGVEQHAFNERLWEQRRREAKADSEAVQALRCARGEGRDSGAQRRLDANLTAELLKAEERRYAAAGAGVPELELLSRALDRMLRGRGWGGTSGTMLTLALIAFAIGLAIAIGAARAP
jgi:hypothetical protein